MTDALKQRKELKARKPTFLAQDHHKKKRLAKRWKRPKGLQSKVRLNKRGYRKGISSGWRSPKAVRGLSPEGLEVVRVENMRQLEAIDAKTQGAMISGRVSIRTKKTLHDAAAAKSITVLNRGASTFNERFDAKMAEREDRKKELAKKEKAKTEKAKKDAEAEKKAEEAEKAAEAKAAEVQKADEKKAAAQEAESKDAAATTQTPKTETKPESKATTPQSAPKKESAEKKADAPQKAAESKPEPKSDDSSKEGSR